MVKQMLRSVLWILFPRIQFIFAFIFEICSSKRSVPRPQDIAISPDATFVNRKKSLNLEFISRIILERRKICFG